MCEEKIQESSRQSAGNLKCGPARAVLSCLQYLVLTIGVEVDYVVRGTVLLLLSYNY